MIKYFLITSNNHTNKTYWFLKPRQVLVKVRIFGGGYDPKFYAYRISDCEWTASCRRNVCGDAQIKEITKDEMNKLLLINILKR